jgi:hypothetical protein
MKELSVFIDESGDWGDYDVKCPYYIIAMVFHDQSVSLTSEIAKLSSQLKAISGFDLCVHAGPTIRGEKEYRDMGLENRRKVLARMTAFVRNADIRYSAIWIDKKHQGDNVSISQGLAKQMKSVIKAHYDEFLSYDVVKVYYDNGQSQVSVLISSVFTVLLDKVEIRKVFPSDYRLFQAADLIATLKLLHLQIENGKATRSEKVFFGSDRNLEKDYLKGIQKKEWPK